jgi:chromatin segregation and condensation protein Rec8/ScpA/Scc1 (kleisin family)
MLEEDVEKVDVEIPEDIINQMQYIDLKKIYSELPAVIEKKKGSTVRNLARDFPVFENDRLSLVAVFNEVLFLANEGKVWLRQMEGDVRVSVLM